MVRFGESQIYHPNIQGNRAAKFFLKIFGTVDTNTSHILFQRAVRKIRFSNTLDAGCGKGKFSFWLAREYPHTLIDAFDLSEENIQLCRDVQKRLGVNNIRFFQGDLVEFQNHETYDFIFSNHVLEHVPENKRALSNLLSSLKSGGTIYIQIPNAVQKRYKWGKKFLMAHEKWAEKEHPGQSFSLDTLARELEERGCEILEKRYLEGFWGELRFEISEMALSHLKSRALFALIFPFLKFFGFMDSLQKYRDGNGLLVIARKVV